MSTTMPPPRRTQGGSKSVARVSSPPQSINVQVVTDATKPSAQRSSYRECFERYIVEARGIPADQIVVYRGDDAIALSNVRIGLDNLAPHLSDVPRHLPLMRFDDITSSADVARAVVFAGMLVPQKTASNAEIRVRTARMLPMRTQVLGVVRTLVDRKAIPASALNGVGTGRGPRSSAADAVRLADAISTNAAAIQGTHPFSAAEISQLRADGEWLLEALRPANAKRQKARREDTRAGDRDRLWTLLLRRHEVLRKVAHYFHGDSLDEVVPPLLSRVNAQLADEVIDAPTPAPLPQPHPVG